MQTLAITRAIFSILAVPLAIIGGAMLALILTFYVFTVNPIFALIPLSIGVLGAIALYRWEQQRIARETPPSDES
jgi:hypothetical protein